MWQGQYQDCSWPATYIIMSSWYYIDGLVQEQRSYIFLALTHWYGNIDLCQQLNIGSGIWLIAWQHQAFTWTNDNWSSVRSCGFPLWVILQEMLKISILDMSLKIINLK